MISLCLALLGQVGGIFPRMSAVAICLATVAIPLPSVALEWNLRNVFAPKGLPSSIWGTTKKPEKDALKPVVFRLRAVKRGAISRLELTLTRKIDVDAFLLDNPDRVILDMPELIFQLDDAGRKGRTKQKVQNSPAGLIKAFRFGALGKDKSRIVIELAGPAKIAKVSTVKIASTVFRLYVDIISADHKEFKSAAAKGRQEAIARNVAKQRPVQGLRPKSSGKPVIVIDPGHGGIDGGARGLADIPEKEIVFAFALNLVKKLNESNKYKVILTRKTDVFVPLGERVEIARRAKARLFISIHADSFSEKWVRGATVYTVSDRASDRQAERLAEKENKADEKAGYELPKEKAEISDILVDLTRRETRAFSHVFANSLVDNWKKFSQMNKNPHRSGRFHVLKAPDVPSVLLELGYLSSKQDATLITSDEWRNKAVARVVTAIDHFFDNDKNRAASNAAASNTLTKTAISSAHEKNSKKQ